MMFFKVAIQEVHGRTQVMSDCYHNSNCPTLNGSETVTLTDRQIEGFDPCGVCQK